MTDLSKTSLIVATDLRTAERSIETAQRDLLAFLLNATEANRALGYSPAMAQPVIRPAIDALKRLSESQDLLSGDAHAAALRTARRLRLTETDFGAGDPKPQAVPFFTDASAEPAQRVDA